MRRIRYTLPYVQKNSSLSEIRRCTLHVCTSCREKGTPREPREKRPGFKLYEELTAKLRGSTLGDHVDIEPARCLSLCPRPCGIALSSSGAWSYLFGDQKHGKTADEILECTATYISVQNGLMTREARPKSLQASILGRVPPLQYWPARHVMFCPPWSGSTGSGESMNDILGLKKWGRLNKALQRSHGPKFSFSHWNNWVLWSRRGHHLLEFLRFVPV